MRADATVAVIVPALNEERSIGLVLAAIPGWVDDVIVADNGSTDRTAEIARAHGARVVGEPAPGYGAACLAGIAALDGAEVVVFLDGDHSDDAGSMAALVDPITAGEADMVLGSRVLGECEPGALSLHQRLGNRLACGLIRLTWRADYSDLGPFRALSYRALREIAMDERGHGWTTEMQVRAARQGLRVRETPTRYRRRVGKSKISGSITGTLRAGWGIFSVIFREAVSPRQGSDPGRSFRTPR